MHPRSFDLSAQQAASRRQCAAQPIDGIVDALAAISDQDLQGLRAMLSQDPIAMPTLRAWLDAAVDWEVNRRTRICRALHDPRITIKESGQLEASLVALAVLHTRLRNVVGVTDFLDATADVLCTDVRAGLTANLH